MEVIDKKGTVIGTENKTVSHDEFIKITESFKEIRAGIEGGIEPFPYIYLKVDKEEVIDTVRMNQMKVTYSIMYNSRIQKHLDDILYIHKMKTMLT